MRRQEHSVEFKEQALRKARQRGSRSIASVAAELNLPFGTLKRWLKAPSKGRADTAGASSLPSDVAAQHWSPAQRLLALHESHGLSGPELHAWCREKGLFEHQLTQWRDAFCSLSGSDERQANAALRELQIKHDVLQRDLRRKDRALAETAALLVLQKKFQALLEDADK